MSDLDAAISQFPISSWCATRMKTYDDGSGTDFYADCPICGAKRKLGISRITKVFHCFRCLEGGHGGEIWTGAASLIRMIKILEGCSWAQAFKTVYQLSGLPEPPPRARPKFAATIPEEAIPLNECSDDEPGLHLLRDRGVLHLRDSAYLCVDGRFRERLVLPTYFKDTLTGFEAKAIYKTQKPRSLFPDDLPTDTTVYTIRAWNPGQKRAAVAESIFDAETFHGVCNAVGVYGKFKEGQIRCLLELDIEELVWFLDGDAWGSICKGIKKTQSLFRNFVVPMPDRDDPNSIGREGCRELLNKAREIKTEWDLMEAALAWGKQVA